MTRLLPRLYSGDRPHLSELASAPNEGHQERLWAQHLAGTEHSPKGSLCITPPPLALTKARGTSRPTAKEPH